MNEEITGRVPVVMFDSNGEYKVNRFTDRSFPKSESSPLGSHLLSFLWIIRGLMAIQRISRGETTFVGGDENSLTTRREKVYRSVVWTKHACEAMVLGVSFYLYERRG